MITPNDQLVWTDEWPTNPGMYWFFDVERNERYILWRTEMMSAPPFFIRIERPRRVIHNVPHIRTMKVAYFGNAKLITPGMLDEAEFPEFPTDALARCPFRGGTASLSYRVSPFATFGTVKYRVGCNDEHCRGFLHHGPGYNARLTAIKRWNKRR